MEYNEDFLKKMVQVGTQEKNTTLCIRTRKADLMRTRDDFDVPVSNSQAISLYAA